MDGREAGLRTGRVPAPAERGPGSPQRACAGISPASQILPVQLPRRFRRLADRGTSCLSLVTISSGAMPPATAPISAQPVLVVGIGADGWEGVPPRARATVLRAAVVLGGR